MLRYRHSVATQAKMRSSVRHLPFVLEEVSGQGFPCESLTAKTPSIWVKGSVAYTTNEDSRQSLLILSRACGYRRVSTGQECTTRPKHRSALAKGAPASISTTASLCKGLGGAQACWHQVRRCFSIVLARFKNCHWRQQQKFIGAVKLAEKNSSHPPHVQFGSIL